MTNINNQISLPELHRSNQILWGALLSGGFLIASVLTFLTFEHPDFYNQGKFLNSLFMPIGLLLTFSTGFLANILVKKRLESVEAMQGLAEKFDFYRSNFILKAALHEGPMLICIIFMFLENNFYFLILAAINWIFLYFTRPTIEKFRENYKLSSLEKQELTSAGL